MVLVLGQRLASFRTLKALRADYEDTVAAGEGANTTTIPRRAGRCGLLLRLTQSPARGGR